MSSRGPRAARLVPALLGLMLVGLSAEERVLAARQAREQVVYVSVVDAQGEPVTGLAADEFVVREDGVAREVLRVGPATDPMHIAVLVDDSQAATRAISDLRKGLQSFVTAVHQGNETALITFGERPTILVEYSATLAQLTAGINRLFARPGAGSYLLEAIIEASRGLERREAQRPVMIVISAEGEEFSNDYYATVLDALRRSNATMHALLLPSRIAGDTSSDEIRNRTIALAEGTVSTGGRREFLLTETSLTPKLDQLARELKHQYRLVYARPESLIPPQKLDVSVRRAGLQARAKTQAGGQ